MATTEGVLQHPVIGPFSGLSFLYKGEYLKEVQSPDCDNVIFDQGEIQKRGGFVPYGGGLQLDGAITGFAYASGVYTGSAAYMIATTVNSCYYFNANSLVPADTNDTWCYVTNGQNCWTVGQNYTPSFEYFGGSNYLVIANAGHEIKYLTQTGGSYKPVLAAFDSDSIVTYAKVVRNFLGFAVLLNNFESLAWYKQRVRHNDGPANINDWTGGTSGFSDLTGHNDEIVNAVVVDNKLVIFKRNSITIGNYYSTTSPFGYDEDVINGYGLAGQNAMCTFPGGIFFMAKTPESGFVGPYVFNLQTISPVGLDVYTDMIYNQPAESSQDYTISCVHVPERREVWTSFQSYFNTYNTIWIWNYVENYWTRFTVPTVASQAIYSGVDVYSAAYLGQTNYATLLGGWQGGYNVYKYTSSATVDRTNDNFTGYWVSKDFYLEDAKGRVVPFNKRRCIFVKLYAYSSTNSYMVCSYSVDQGATYTNFNSLTLSTTPTVYELPLDCIGNMIRFKFSGTGAGQFKIKGFSVHYIDLGVSR